MPPNARSPVFPLLAAAGLVLAGCGREERRFRDAPAGLQGRGIVQSELHPGSLPIAAPAGNPFEGNAQATAEGRQLYLWFNCAGCHFNGGGGIGPPLMDDAWIYGSEPANIFATIVEGRPNGMPSFRRQLTDRQVWQLVAYVRSLSKLPDAPDQPERKQGGGSSGEKKGTSKSGG